MSTRQPPPPGDRTTVWTPEPDRTVVWHTENRDVELLDRTRMWDAPPDAKPTTFSQRYEPPAQRPEAAPASPHAASPASRHAASPDDARPTTFAQRYVDAPSHGQRSSDAAPYAHGYIDAAPHHAASPDDARPGTSPGHRRHASPDDAYPTTIAQRYEASPDDARRHRDASPDDAHPTTIAQRYEASPDDARPTTFAQRYVDPAQQREASQRQEGSPAHHEASSRSAPRRNAPPAQQREAAQREASQQHGAAQQHEASQRHEASSRSTPRRNAPPAQHRGVSQQREAAQQHGASQQHEAAQQRGASQRHEASSRSAPRRNASPAQQHEASSRAAPHMSAPHMAAPLMPQARLPQGEPRLARVPQQPIAMAPPPAGLAQGSAPSPIGLTPMLEREVFHLARRIALQSDLSSAVRVLRQGLAQLTDADDAVCIFFDPGLCSVWALPDGDAPREVSDAVQQVVARVAASGERVFVEAAIVEPVGAAPARAVLVVRRAPQRPAFGPLELAVVTAIAHAVTGILAHFQADHAARKAQAERDARTPFRPEALAERRRASAAPGKVVATPRTWIRWAFPTLCALVMSAVIAAVLIQVPAYSTGIAIVTVDGEQITSPLPGTVAEVVVAPNARVAVGDPLVRTRAVQEDAEAAAADADYRNALALFLTNPGDDGARTGLAALATRRQRAKAAVDARTIRATTAGIVGDVRVRVGQLLVPGGEIMKISPEGAAPSVIALLPGTDRPRLAPGMTVQIELPGYRKKREEAVIDSIATQVVGPEEVRRSLGDPIGDALPINGPVVVVRAHLSAKTFEADGREYELHDGMLGKAEIKIDQQSLLRALFGKGG